MEEVYNGERVIAKYEAKILPSNREHYDFVSTLMLTDQYLYVLEPNGDGSYAEYFQFGIREVDAIEIKRADSAAQAKQKMKKGFARAFQDIVMLCCGWIRLPSEGQGKWNAGNLIVKYHTKQNQDNRLYFRIGSKETDSFLEAFHKLRRSYGCDETGRNG